jgi:hypothetical protein
MITLSIILPVLSKSFGTNKQRVGAIAITLVLDALYIAPTVL